VDILNIDVGGAGVPYGTYGVVGPLYNASSVAIVNDNFKGIKGFKDPGDTPYTCRLDIKAGNMVGQMQMLVSKTQWPGYMSPILTVYETEPIESKLDIYWETSTSGLVSNLNTQIGASDSWSPYGFGAYDGFSPIAPVVYAHNESFALGTSVIGLNAIFIQRFDGTRILGGDNSFSLASVIDGLGNERKTEFTLNHAAGDDHFGLETNGYFMYGVDANVKENYTFYINYTVPAPTFALDGSLLTGVLELGYWTGSGFSPTNCQLANSTPSFSSAPFALPTPSGTLTLDSTTGAISPSGDFSAINGSNTTGTLESEEITFSFFNGDKGVFYLDSSSVPNGSIVLKANPGKDISGNTYSLTLRATDGGGQYVDQDFDVVVN
jgi:hypothetical protein